MKPDYDLTPIPGCIGEDTKPTEYAVGRVNGISRAASPVFGKCPEDGFRIWIELPDRHLQLEVGFMSAVIVWSFAGRFIEAIESHSSSSGSEGREAL